MGNRAGRPRPGASFVYAPAASPCAHTGCRYQRARGTLAASAPCQFAQRHVDALARGEDKAAVLDMLHYETHSAAAAAAAEEHWRACVASSILGRRLAAALTPDAVLVFRALHAVDPGRFTPHEALLSGKPPRLCAEVWRSVAENGGRLTHTRQIQAVCALAGTRGVPATTLMRLLREIFSVKGNAILTSGYWTDSRHFHCLELFTPRLRTALRPALASGDDDDCDDPLVTLCEAACLANHENFAPFLGVQTRGASPQNVRPAFAVRLPPRHRRRIYMSAVRSDKLPPSGATLLKEFQDDDEVVLAAVTRHGSSLRTASERVRNLKRVALAAVSKFGSPYEHVGDAHMKRDRDVCRAAFSRFGMALQYAPEEIRDDAELVLVAVLQSKGAALSQASERLRNDSDMVRTALSLDGRSIGWASARFRADPISASIAVDNNPWSVERLGELHAHHPELLVRLACKALRCQWRIVDFLPREILFDAVHGGVLPSKKANFRDGAWIQLRRDGALRAKRLFLSACEGWRTCKPGEPGALTADMKLSFVVAQSYRNRHDNMKLHRKLPVHLLKIVLEFAERRAPVKTKPVIVFKKISAMLKNFLRNGDNEVGQSEEQNEVECGGGAGGEWAGRALDFDVDCLEAATAADPRALALFSGTLFDNSRESEAYLKCCRSRDELQWKLFATQKEKEKLGERLLSYPRMTGDRVLAKSYGRESYAKCRILKVHRPGVYDIEFDWGGEINIQVPENQITDLVERPAAAAAAAVSENQITSGNTLRAAAAAQRRLQRDLVRLSRRIELYEREDVRPRVRAAALSCVHRCPEMMDHLQYSTLRHDVEFAAALASTAGAPGGASK